MSWMFYRTYLNCKVCSKFKYYCSFSLYGDKILFCIQTSTSCIKWSQILKSSETFNVCKLHDTKIMQGFLES